MLNVFTAQKIKRRKQKLFFVLHFVVLGTLPVIGISQTLSRNYIKTWTATAPETDPNNLLIKPLRDVKLTTAYFDGLGRPEQTVLNKGSLTGAANTDLVT